METIFSCEFHPENPDLLATASFDGTVKVWNITNMTLVFFLLVLYMFELVCLLCLFFLNETLRYI